MDTNASNSRVHETNDDPTTKLPGETGGIFSPWLDLEHYYSYLDLLIRIHFILRKDVISFIEDLPKRLRSIKTIVIKNPENVKGRIDGIIDWHGTIKSRYSQNPKDITHFVIDRIERDYNITENLVLKELLSIIHIIIHDDLPIAIEQTNKYPWLKKLVKEKRLREVVRDTYLKNIYIRRITKEERSTVNERMIVYTLKSRNPLYREAARLLESYRKMAI